MRSYAGIFSTTAFAKLLKLGDLSFLQSRIAKYDSRALEKGQFESYLDYIKFAYNQLGKNYRNEYFFKNSIINEAIIKHYSLKNTVAFSEFKVGKSVADLTLFNGYSKTFEIKTKMDSPKRLKGQLTDYKKLFNFNYIVTDSSQTEKYLKEDEHSGVIALHYTKGKIYLTEDRPATENHNFDAEIAMKCLRTKEYQSVVKAYYGYLPQMTSFNMYDVCLGLFKDIPPRRLNELFIEAIKSRKFNIEILTKFELELRQVALAMNLNQKKYQNIIDQLNNPIKL
ncbi:sce7726 family protein [Lentimicrobium sp. S6]|uniref:sce7726 family protein n=1 Tax=Lentimicrobium sp. S6 TaxID=2735872 RepID=UPI00155645A2|nr:sce7726 family protein [Lentimicrobium sp. S6]NPD47909.1 sce7726 family protein [Lentimicrobium sp. S6]